MRLHCTQMATTITSTIQQSTVLLVNDELTRVGVGQEKFNMDIPKCILGQIKYTLIINLLNVLHNPHLINIIKKLQVNSQVFNF